MSRFREISTEISPSNVINTPRRGGAIPRASDVSSQLLETPIELDQPSSSRPRPTRTDRMHMPAKPRMNAPASSNENQAQLVEPLRLASSSDEESAEYTHSEYSDEDEYYSSPESAQLLHGPLAEEMYYPEQSEIPFSHAMASLLDRMRIPLSSAQRLWEIGVHFPEKLFILKENELQELCDFRLMDVLSFRLAKAQFEQNRSQNLPSGLVAAMPIFRGKDADAKSIQDPVTFLQRFEAVMQTTNVNESRWGTLLTLNLSRPEDSAFWRNHLDVHPTHDWSIHRRIFLEHFECYDQRSKYVDAVYSLSQKSDETVQRYFDKAADTVRKAQLSLDDPLVINCLRRGIFSDKLKEYITLREEPRRVFSYHQLMSIALLGEDRLKIVPKAIRSPSPAVESNAQRCFKCKRVGHMASQCRKGKRPTTEKSGDDKQPAAAKKPKVSCPRCPGESHPLDKCPNKSCLICNQKGHLNFNCPTATCKTCGAKGHTAASFQCPKRLNKRTGFYSDGLVGQDRTVVRQLKEREFLLRYEFEEKHENHESILVGAVSQGESKPERDNSVTIPVMIANYRLLAMVDTGASHSFLDESILGEIGLTDKDLEPVNEEVRTLFVTNEITPIVRTPILKLAVGQHRVNHSFFVAPMFTNAVIGRDLLSRIGITLTGLPVSFPELQDDAITQQTSENTSNDESHEVFNTLPRIPENELVQLMEKIEVALTTNEKISESDFCTHSEATVSITMDDKSPIFRPQFPIPDRHQPIIEEQIEKWLINAKIEKTSPANRWNSSLLLVPKQDLYGNKSDWRVCFDARAINARLKPDTYGIPRIKELFQRISGFNYCSSLDLVAAYQQLLVKEEDRDILTFTWKGQKYRFKGAPFGLTHLPGQFQRLMNCVLAEHYSYVLIYLDDVFIFSETLDEHIKQCNAVIDTLTENNLRLRRGKCHFGFREAVLLGHVISGKGIRADPRKVATFSAMKPPTTGKQLQAILGFASYLRDYIPYYSRIAAPLESIKNVRKLSEYWKDEHAEAFQKLKTILASGVVLSTPDFEQPFMVATDSSQFGNGGVLYQMIDGKIKYIQFFAKALNKSQINYPATKRELLAIVQALRSFRYYLYGRHFDLFTDHKALTFLFTTKDPSYMLLNWMEELMSYNFSIHHRPGIEMVLPDALSRLFDKPQNFEEGDESAKSGNTADLIQLAATELVIKTSRCRTCKARTAKACGTGFCKVHCPGCKIHAKQVNQSSNDVNLSNPIVIDDTNPNRVKSWMKEFIANVVQKREPEDEQQAMELVRREHDGSHAGAEQMFKSLFRKGYYWSEMKKQCSFISNSCVNCLQFNIARQGYHPLTTISASLPFDHIAVDLGQISHTSQEGNNFILVVTDICTRFTLLRAIPNKSALVVARQLYHIFTEFGLPRIIQSDNGTEFVNGTIQAMKEHCGFAHRTISSYHPQANGTAESHVKLTKQLLSKYVNGDWSEWCVFVPSVQLAMNTRITQRHGSTPFSLMFTRSLNEFENHQGVSSKLLSEEEMIARNSQLTRILFPAVSSAVDAYNEKMIDDFKLSHRVLENGYPKGAYVMKRVDVRISKGEPRYEGPFKILEKSKNNAYSLLDASGALYQKRVPADQLKLISVPDVLLNEQEHFEVEKILKHRGPPSAREYWVKWKNYASSENSWVVAKDFDSPQVIQEYWRLQKSQKSLPKNR